MDLRIGTGIDVHEFTEGRPLMLGGVLVPCDLGLKGHSDADVLLHAVCDALLGALALGDIGKHFPDTDSQYQGIDSKRLLQHVYALIQQHGFRLMNLDTVVAAQYPRLQPHISKMQECIASLLDVPTDRISIKATTTEHLGFVGRREGILAHATLLLCAA